MQRSCTSIVLVALFNAGRHSAARGGVCPGIKMEMVATSCSRAEGACEQGCREDPAGPVCECQPGYTLQPDGFSCRGQFLIFCFSLHSRYITCDTQYTIVNLLKNGLDYHVLMLTFDVDINAFDDASEDVFGCVRRLRR